MQRNLGAFLLFKLIEKCYPWNNEELVRTEFILFTMVAHFMERIVSTEIRRRKYTIK